MRAASTDTSPSCRKRRISILRQSQSCRFELYVQSQMNDYLKYDFKLQICLPHELHTTFVLCLPALKWPFVYHYGLIIIIDGLPFRRHSSFSFLFFHYSNHTSQQQQKIKKNNIEPNSVCFLSKAEKSKNKMRTYLRLWSSICLLHPPHHIPNQKSTQSMNVNHFFFPVNGRECAPHWR